MDRISYVLILLAAALVLVPGCIAAEQNKTISNTTSLHQISVIEGVNNTTVTSPTLLADENLTKGSLKVNQTALISLKEPTNGSTWNTTVTSGLKIVNKTPRSNGTSKWTVEAIKSGANSFSATEMNGKDKEKNSYTLTIFVE